MADKKLREELRRPDDFESFVHNVVEGIAERKREVLAIIVIVVLAFGGLVTYQVQREGANERAADALTKLLASWPIEAQPGPPTEEDPASKESEESWRKFLSEAELFMNEHSSSAMEPVVEVYRARAFLALGEYDKALEAYRNVKAPGNSELEILALEGEGLTLFSLKKWSEAQMVFQRLADEEANPLSESHRWYLAQTHDRLGNLEEATKIYEELSSGSPGSPIAEKAKIRLSALEKAKKES